MCVKPLINGSRLRCDKTGKSESLFFSIVDYRNSYFTSNDPDKIIEFYDGFENRDQLIQWMKERPRGMHTIYEVEGDREIIVVIPTADYNGKFAKECRENIFKGLHMVFVESGGKGDFYFNYAHNCNVGIKKAMEYNPKWIVVSNDDMYKIDDVSKLLNKLNQIKDNNIKTVFVNKSLYHSRSMYLTNPRKGYGIVLKCLSKYSSRWKYTNELFRVLKKFNSRSIYYPKNKDEFEARRISLISIKDVIMRSIDFIWLKKLFSFINTNDFMILSGTFMKEKGANIFDETYINEMEDIDLSIILCRDVSSYTFIDYRIGDYIGSALGKGIARGCRAIPGYTYLSEKISMDYVLWRSYGVMK